jgi:uncharacterized membrane protein YqgA involved in biofilm formation
LLGTIVNSLAIIGGSLLGFVLKGGIPERVNDTIMKGLALCIMVIGISGAIKSENMILIICSIVIGALIGDSHFPNYFLLIISHFINLHEMRETHKSLSHNS